MKKLLLSLILPFFLLTSLVYGQVPLTTSGSAVLQNFDAMGAIATAALPADWKVSAPGSAAPAYSSAGNFTATNQQASSGSPTAGGRYNWGSSTSDRAIGFMTSGSYANPSSIMVACQNGNANPLTSLDISFKVERYRINTAAASVQFYYSADGTSWTAVPAADVTTTELPAGASTYTFSSGTSIPKTANLTGLTVPAGGLLYLRWNFNTTGGNSQGIGLDDVSLTPVFAGTGTAAMITSNLSHSAVYGTAAPDYLITASNNPTSFTATGLPPGLSINSSTGVISGTPAGTAGSPYTVQISASSATETASANLIYTVSRKNLTISGLTADDKIYDGTLTATLSGTAILNGLVGADIVSLSGTPKASFASATVGTNKPVTVSGYTLSGSDALNYTIQQPTGLTASISSTPVNTPVFISQYYEGTGTNKWIELTNPGSTDINTAAPQLKLGLFGVSGDTGTMNLTGSPSATMDLNFIIPAHGTVLIGNTANSEVTYLNSASAIQNSNTVINFNGNDAIALMDIAGNILDGFGQGINAKDVSYVRNPGIIKGSAAFVLADWNRQTIVTVQNAIDTDDPNRLGTHIAADLPACVSPVNAPGNLSFTAAGFTSIGGAFAAAADASDYLVIRTTDSLFSGIPADGTLYSAGSALGNGIVVSVGPATSFNAGGLANGTTYYFTVFSYNNTGCAGGPLYYTANRLEGSSTTSTPQPCAVPASQPSGFSITSSSYNYIQGSFTATLADEYLVVMSTSNTLSSDPVNGHVYVPGESIGGGTVVKRGAGNTFLKTGLAAGTAYYFSVFALNSDCGGGPVYQTLAPLTGSATTGVSSAGNLNYYYGNLHAHSSSSDGNKDDLTKTPSDDFAFARSAMHMDFLGISEHNHTGAGMDLADWQPGVNAARASTSSSFVAMYGMEWGTISGGGHVLVYGIDSLIGWEPGQNQIYVPKSVYTGSTGLFRIVNRHGNNAVGLLAHPNKTDYNNLVSTYDADADLAIVGSAVESGPAFSTNVTYSDPGSPMSYLGYYQQMLSKGYHIGPSIDHDNHNYTFGKTAESRLVILAPSLSESELLNSLKQMRFYATEDFGAQVSFTINSQPLGSEFTAANAPNIDVNAITTKATDSVKIYYGQPGSGILPVLLTASAGGKLSFRDTTLANLSTGYYYADISATDGTRTLTSPIWYTRDDSALPPKKNQNITFAALAPRVYGDGDFDPAASSDNPSTEIIYSSSDENIATIINNRVHIRNAGTVSITANQPGDAAYNAAASQSQILQITAKPLTVIADAQTKVYGQADPVFTFTTSPAMQPADVLSGSPSRTAGEDAGNYAINQGDLANSNYILSFEPSVLTITPKAIIVSAEPKTKVYGEVDPSFTFSTSEPLLAGNSFDGSLQRAAGENTGSYAITQGDLSLSGNYLITFRPAELTIAAREITITADSKTKVYGSADPEFTYSISGTLMTGDTFTGTLQRAAGENTGTYSITQGSLGLSSNYLLNFRPADLIITAKAITLAAEAKSKIYGEADPALTFTIAEALPAGTVSGSLARIAGENAGSYSINQGDLSAGANYTINFLPASLSIGTRSLLITADDKVRVQGIENPQWTLSYTGFVNGETSAVFSTQASVTTTANSASPAGTYPIIVSGAIAGNYSITYRNGTLSIVAGTPTVLGAFDARASGNSVRLTWSTLSEYKNDYFAVERSRNGKKFEELKRVKGSFYSEVPVYYVTYDDAPFDGNSYYRLKQTNLDGTFTYSRVVGVKMALQDDYKLLIYPNPVQNEILISFDGKQPLEQEISLKVINTQGSIVFSAKGSLSSLNEFMNANLRTLSAGIYVLHLSGNSFVSTAKFIKQ